VVLAGDRAVDARCVGPGLGTGGPAAHQVLEALAAPAPVLVDASGLDVLATMAGRSALAQRAAEGWLTVLTPHSGEFARLGLDPAGGPLACAARAAGELGAVVVLKGPGTVVAAPHGPVFVDAFATSALACAGSGDVLAGLAAGMLATAARAGGLSGADAAEVVARAVGLHGLAGRLAAAAGSPVTASDVLDHLPAALAGAATATP
jgi:NAD(P)H-hydrate repair Nnr-like enzyme with NAD(P)H-hydrate dehydratase domain